MNTVLQEHISLADKNWFKTGGSARWFSQPTNAQEFQTALIFAHKHSLPIFILGEGANILISDSGFDGLVIKPQLKTITIAPYDETSVLVTAGAGVSVHDLIEFCLDNNISGLEEFSGIPSSVGGAVYINLHYFEFLLSHFLVAAQVLEKTTHEIFDVDNEWFDFGYNQSKLIAGSHYLMSATFKLKKISDKEVSYARGRRQEIMRHRFKRYPVGNTCGSFFRNFYAQEVTLESNGQKMIYVAYYLDKIGVKGNLRVGNAQVSHQHANMIVSLPGATSADIISLARTMQELVYKNFDIVPQAECRLVGFKEYPLL